MIKKIYVALSLIFAAIHANDVTVREFSSRDEATRHQMLIAIAAGALKSPTGTRPFLNPRHSCQERIENALRGQIAGDLGQLLTSYEPQDADAETFFTDERLTQFAHNNNDDGCPACRNIGFATTAHFVQLHYLARRLSNDVTQAQEDILQIELPSFLAEKLHDQTLLQDIDANYHRTITTLQTKFNVNQRPATGVLIIGLRPNNAAQRPNRTRNVVEECLQQ